MSAEPAAPAVHDPTRWSAPRRAVEAADRVLYQFERAICIGVLGGMGFLVALAVLHREFVRPGGLPSKLESMVLKLFGSPTSGWAVDWGADLVLGLFFWLIAFSALRRRVVRKGEVPRTAAVHAGMATGAIAVLGLLTYLFVTKVPSFGWPGGVAQYFMLWVGFIGASLATYDRRHLALEMGQKLWPKKALPYVAAMARLMTAAFCIFFLYLGWLSLKGHFESHHRFDAQIDLAGWPNPAYQIPLWFVFMIIPYTFAVMALRFFKQAVLALWGEGLEAGSELPTALMNDTNGEAPALEAAEVSHPAPREFKQ